jgi:transposase
MELPEWVLKHKEKGTEIHAKKSGYYLYKITSRRDPVKKRPKKITEKYLGVITPEGVIKSKHERILEGMKNITTKEFGASWFVLEHNKDIVETLKVLYPHSWKEILVFSLFRLLYNSPIKNIQLHYTTSFVSETIHNAHVSPKKIGDLLGELGKERGKIRKFLSTFISGTEFAIIDVTQVFSFSENIISSTLGYNSKKEFSPQVNMVFLFSLDHHMPAYFRMVPGSIRDVSSFVLTVKESGVKNVVLIGDKGFYSEDNVKDLKALKQGGIHYILPLKRNLSLIDYRKIQSGDKRNFDGYFPFEKRVIWYYSYNSVDERKITVFLDGKLKAEEEKDSLIREEEVEENNKEDDDLEEFFEKQYTQGTIAVITDLNKDAKTIYEFLKCRVEIEVMFDAFKNTLDADRTYMRDDYHMEGWMFINFIALLFYYRMYRLLVDNEILNNYTPKDVFLHFSRIYKLNINDNWVLSEIPKKTRKILEKLNLCIT